MSNRPEPYTANKLRRMAARRPPLAGSPGDILLRANRAGKHCTYTILATGWSQGVLVPQALPPGAARRATPESVTEFIATLRKVSK